MTGPLATVAIVLPLLLACWAAVQFVMNRPPGRPLWAALGLLELVLIAFLVWGVVSMLTRTTDFARLEFVLYLLGLAAVVPVAGWWVRDERSRATAAVIVVALLVVPIMVVRVQQVWSGV